MTQPTLPPHAGNGNRKTQIGPPFYCFECNAPASRIVCYTTFLPPRTIPKPVDAWGAHIWYLYLPADCQAAGHRGCVARLGDAITPLVLYDDHGRIKTRTEALKCEEQAIRRVREALAAIATMHGPNPQADPATAIVYKLVAGVLPPQAAIAGIHRLAQVEMPSVVNVLQESVLALQKVAP